MTNEGLLLIAAFLAFAPPVMAQETRRFGAHEHGVGRLEIAVDGKTIAIALKAPGADIVGFEHIATSAADRDRVQTAIATLARPLTLFALPEAAQCQVARVEIPAEEQGLYRPEAELSVIGGKPHWKHLLPTVREIVPDLPVG